MNTNRGGINHGQMLLLMGPFNAEVVVAPPGPGSCVVLRGLVAMVDDAGFFIGLLSSKTEGSSSSPKNRICVEELKSGSD